MALKPTWYCTVNCSCSVIPQEIIVEMSEMWRTKHSVAFWYWLLVIGGICGAPRNSTKHGAFIGWNNVLDIDEGIFSCHCWPPNTHLQQHVLKWHPSWCASSDHWIIGDIHMRTSLPGHLWKRLGLCGCAAGWLRCTSMFLQNLQCFLSEIISSPSSQKVILKGCIGLLFYESWPFMTFEPWWHDIDSLIPHGLSALWVMWQRVTHPNGIYHSISINKQVEMSGKHAVATWSTPVDVRWSQCCICPSFHKCRWNLLCWFMVHPKILKTWSERHLLTLDKGISNRKPGTHQSLPNFRDEIAQTQVLPLAIVHVVAHILAIGARCHWIKVEFKPQLATLGPIERLASLEGMFRLLNSEHGGLRQGQEITLWWSWDGITWKLPKSIWQQVQLCIHSCWLWTQPLKIQHVMQSLGKQGLQLFSPSNPSQKQWILQSRRMTPLTFTTLRVS